MSSKYLDFVGGWESKHLLKRYLEDFGCLGHSVGWKRCSIQPLEALEGGPPQHTSFKRRPAKGRGFFCLHDRMSPHVED